MNSRTLASALLLLSACASELDAQDVSGEDETEAAGARAIDPTHGGLGELCSPAGACDGRLICGSTGRCLDPIAATAPWLESFQACDSNDPDCNVCANHVKQQFDDAFAGQMRWDSASWGFNWETNYPPSNREPDNVFEGHVQGFARTNRDPYRFVGSYSDETGGNGGIFFIHRDDDGHKRLRYLHTARHAHPSGVSVLGRFVAFSDAANTVRLIDMNRIDEAHLIDFVAPGMSRAGGGLGLTKLANNGWLLVVSPKGSSDGNDREVRFYHLSGSILDPVVKSVGIWDYEQPDSWQGDYRYTENLTVIPECGTGDVYVVNASGDDRLLGRGYFLLSKVIQRPGAGLGLKPLRAYHMDQEQSNCHLRSAATAWIDGHHNLQLLCHERKSINGVFDGNADNMRFRHGYNYAD